VLRAWGGGLLCREPPPPPRSATFPFAGRGGTELGRKRGGKGVGAGAWSQCLVLSRGLGRSGAFHTETPEGRRRGAEHSPPPGTARTRREHPLGELLPVLRALSPLSPPAPAPALPLSCGGPCVSPGPCPVRLERPETSARD